ncbi:MAG: hypothetical protein ABI605_10890 [Rhizobacter sp.]
MKYEALQAISFHPGSLLRLTKAQQARTAGLVRPAEKKEGWFEVVSDIQIKRGEAFECDAEFPKGFVDAIEAKRPAKAVKNNSPAEAVAPEAVMSTASGETGAGEIF